MPKFNDYKSGKVPLEEGAFDISVEKKEIHLKADGKSILIGTHLIYVVE